MPRQTGKTSSLPTTSRSRRKSGDLNGDNLPLPPQDDVDMNPDIDMQPIEVKRTPIDQVSHLTEEQLNEVFTKVLSATNPNVAKNITRFQYTEGTFKTVPTATHMAVHFEMEGVLIHVDSDEAHEQAEYIAQAQEIERKSVATATEGSDTQRSDKVEEEEEEEDDGDWVEDDRALKNQFNFSERASQTFNNPLRDRDVSTEPPPTVDFADNVTHWDIFDAYVDDLEKQVVAREKKEKPKKTNEDDAVVAAPTQTSRIVDVFSTHAGLALALKTMERMVNQSAEAQFFHDYKYYEDKSEAKRADQQDKRGSFLPLWKFTFEPARRKTVTAITWNPEYTDLFAVAYGSYDFMKQSPGVICCYSLKNTQFPEYYFRTESGVMCLDWHVAHTALLVAGLYDGTVSVYDVRGGGEPIYQSSDPKVKHTDPVWQVRWQKEEPGKNINFFSVSSDGRVSNWSMNKNELISEDVIELKLMSGTKDHEEVPDSAMVGLAGGCCFDFNPVNEHLFLVGTEEGAIQSYSKAYNSQFLRAFEGHHMAVYAVRWNPFHPHVFLTCSADWTVKLWEINTSKPVMTFDLNCSAGDVAWAPYSSTVFAVVTSDGKVRVFDLNVNKHEAIGETRVNKKAKLTHVCFNPKEPILCVGDDRGVVNILKLSANLRKTTAPTLAEIDVEEEIEKLDRLLIITDKEPNMFPIPSATANLLPQKKKPDEKKRVLKSPLSPTGSKPNTQPNTARDVKPVKKEA